MSCNTATSCGDCLADQWYRPTNALNFTSGPFCQWCFDTNTCVSLKNASACSGSSLFNFENQICPELNCGLKSFSTSPYICSQSGVIIFCLTIFAALLIGLTVFLWRRSSKAMKLRGKMNSRTRGDYSGCRECGEASQNDLFLCAVCFQHQQYFGVTMLETVCFLMGLWYTIVTPEPIWMAMLSGVIATTIVIFIVKILRGPKNATQTGLLSSQYSSANQNDVEANDRLTFGLDGISTNQLRFSVAKEISQENQAVNFVLETTPHLDTGVIWARILLGLFIWISLAPVMIGLGNGNRNLLGFIPIAVMMPTLSFIMIWPMKSRKYAIVITSKNIIVAQESSGKVPISSVKLTDVKQISITKTEGFDQYGELIISKNDGTYQPIIRLSSIVELEAALMHAGFEGKLQEKRHQIPRNWCARNIIVIISLILIVPFGFGFIFMTALFFLGGFKTVLLWGGMGSGGISIGTLLLVNPCRAMNPYLRDTFVYTKRS